MVFRKKWALIAFGILLFSVLLFALKAPRLTPGKKLTAGDISACLQDGDIICRLGNRFWSKHFKDISPVDKRFSHLGIIRISDDRITVIHAEGRAVEGKDFVNEVDLDEFLEIALAAGIYRLNNYLNAYNGKISSAAEKYIGYPFDWNFDFEEKNKIYCSELLYVVLKEIAPEIQLQTVYQKEIKRELIPLEAVSHSEYFDEIAFVTLSN